MFVSIKGRPITWFERAIEQGDLASAWSSAHELGSLPIDHALALVVLMARDPDHSARLDAATVRWILRFAGTRPAPSLSELRSAVDALAELPDLVAATRLGDLCERHRWDLAAIALGHLLPHAGPPAPHAGTPRRRARR